MKGERVQHLLSQLFFLNPGFMSPPETRRVPSHTLGVARLGHQTHVPSTLGILWNPTLGMGRDRSQKTSKVVERYPQAWHLRQLFNWPTNRSRQK